MHIGREALIIDKEHQAVIQQSRDLQTLFEDEKHIKNGATKLFKSLNIKLDLMIWLLDSILSGHDVRTDPDYLQRMSQNAAFLIPESETSSKIFPLLKAFYHRVDDYISELNHVVENSIHGKVFMYHQPSPKPFNAELFIKGLKTVAGKGNWLAKVIISLVSKLNYYESLFSRLKKAYQNLSDTQSWPTENVNLGAGGFAVHLKGNFDIGAKTCALFQMDDEFVFAKSRCVHQEKESGPKSLMRTAFQFDDISAEDSAHIVRFLMAKELEFNRKER